MTDYHRCFELPQYDADEFTTEVECLKDTPGFFPVHSGRLAEGLSKAEPPQVVIVGLDWGEQTRAAGCREAFADRRPCRCQSFRPEVGERYPTEGKLFDVLVEVGVELKTVFMTNAVLGLAAEQSGNTSKFSKHQKYLRDCGDYHRVCLDAWNPRLVVLMGAPHVGAYGRHIWSRVWPELFERGGRWRCARSLGQLFSRADETVARTESGARVQLTYHPASRGEWSGNWKRTVAELAMPPQQRTASR